MNSRNAERDSTEKISVLIAVEGTAAECIMLDTCSRIIGILFQAVCYKLTCNTGSHFIKFFAVPVHDQCAVCRYLGREDMEGVRDVIKVFEKIQVIGVHIQDHSYGGYERQEAVRVLACFRDERVGCAYSDVSADCGKDSAYRNRRVAVSGHKDVSDHRGGRRFAVCAGYGNGLMIILHQLAEKLRTCEHGTSRLRGCCELRVIRMDSCRIDDDVYIRCDVLCFLPDGHDGTVRPEVLDEVRVVCVRTCDFEASAEKNFRQTAHADSADSYKMYMLRSIEINLIHKISLNSARI